MIDGSEKRNRQLVFELQNSHVCEKRSKDNVRLVEVRRKFIITNYVFESNLRRRFYLGSQTHHRPCT